MNINVFNAGLIAGWFLVTVGGILLSPAAGLMIAGVALIVLTLFVSLRYGIFSAGPQKEGKTPGSGAA